jgi:hypothetical protein
MRVIWGAFGLIIVGYWLAFRPLSAARPGLRLRGGRSSGRLAAPSTPALAAHFNKNSNLAWAFDTWFLNLFPRIAHSPTMAADTATLSFIPTLGTMILGLIAGRWLRAGLARQRAAEASCRSPDWSGSSLGLLLHYTGICPLVKRIWTPGWTHLQRGCCFLLLAGFYYLVDHASRGSEPVFPLRGDRDELDRHLRHSSPDRRFCHRVVEGSFWS